MRRSSNGSAKPYQPLPPQRRASFNGGLMDADYLLLQNESVVFEQQQQVQTPKKSPRKLLNSLPPSPPQKLPLNGSIQPTPAPLTTIPSLSVTSNMGSNGTMPSSQDPHANLPSNLYKTELCRSFEETGTCRYGSKCQFAHGYAELRPAPRHPKYKTEICKTFHSVGTCPYGTRCRFIHTSPSDNIDWITADVDNPLFDLHDKNAPEFDRSPNTIPSYQSAITRLPPVPRYQQPQAHMGYASQINNSEPLSVVRTEIPRLEPTPRVESRTLLLSVPNYPATAISRPATNSNATPASTATATASNISTMNISTATMNIAAAITAAAAVITPPLPKPTTANNPVAPATTTNNMSKPPSPPLPVATSSVATGNALPANGAPALSHKHRLPVFRELCHQSSVERLQQQVLDFVFEKEQ